MTVLENERWIEPQEDSSTVAGTAHEQLYKLEKNKEVNLRRGGVVPVIAISRTVQAREGVRLLRIC